MAAARAALDFAIESLDAYDAPDIIRAGAVEPIERVRLCAPVPSPGKIVGVEANYPNALSAAEVEPTFYLKAPSSVIGCEDDVLLPDDGSQVSCAGHLAIVVGSRARGVSEREALRYVAGYCTANDLIAFLPGVDDPARFGRSHDTFCPLGPALITADEIPDPMALALRTDIFSASQGPESQLSAKLTSSTLSSTTKEMRIPIPELIARISTKLTLKPGDVILTGSGSDSRRALRDGDIVEVEIESLGRLRNNVRAPR